MNPIPTQSDSMEVVSIETVRERAARLLESRQEIASVVLTMASHNAGQRAKRLEALGRWFQQDMTPDELFEERDALAICLPMLQRVQKQPLSQTQIEGSAGRLPVPDDLSSRRRLLLTLAYPMTVIFLSAIVLLGFSLFLVPQFEQMFNEFGLTLPTATRWIIGVSQFLREWGAASLFVGSVLIVASFVLLRHGFLQRSFQQHWGWSVGTLGRGSLLSGLAKWSRHVSTLMETGMAQADAIEIAGRATHHAGIELRSQHWSASLRSGGCRFADLRVISNEPCSLLAFALQHSDRRQQIELLDEIATIYADRVQTRMHARAVWISPLVITLVGFAVSTVVAALFMPLIELIRGLT